MKKLRLVTVLTPLLAAMITLTTATVARADFPGVNGRLVFQRNGDLYSILASGSGLTRLTTTGGSTPRWSADGRHIVFVRSGGVWIMAADGSQQRKVGTGWGPSLSPDGQHLAFIRTIVNPKKGNPCLPHSVWGNYIVEHVIVTSLAQPATSRTLYTVSECVSGDSNDYFTSGVRWTPDGKSLIVAEDQLANDAWSATIDEILAATGHVTPTVTLYCSTADCPDPNYTPTVDLQPDISPNGQQYVFVSDEAHTRNTQLYRASRNGSAVTYVGGDAHVSGPVWSPDGSEWAYTQRIPGHAPQIRVVKAGASGRRPATVVTNASEVDWQP